MTAGAVLRALRIIAVLAGAVLRLALTRSRADTIASTMPRLGPTFLKAAQLLSTRVDLLPAAVCRGLAHVHDDLPPIPVAAVLPRLPRALLDSVDGDIVPAAAGSIACVYRAKLVDGRVVAIKVRRPGVAVVIARDLVLVTALARLAERFRLLGGMPVVAVVAELGAAIRQQLDFVAEVVALRALRTNLGAMPDVCVPEVFGEHCTADVIVMEHLPLPRGRTGGDAARQATVAALRAVYQMLFLDGFVHCDLHPGNLYALPDGRAVIVDAGFCRRLTDSARHAFATFFYRMSRGDGAACADVVLATARASASADPEGFRARMIRLIDGGTRGAVGEFELVPFAVELFAMQREHGFSADPEFVFPVLSLIVLEGTLRQTCPEVDFQLEALPFVLRGLMT
ncbi:AarF/UbiB family protein [Lentzea sp. BCCO 10_0856]|uniref:AarF/UbiB family protein n=1 Tax=Lentzea miocenica TaxID=3095431 RepID=A0ABU4TFV2_9PSEU|nr:AarF/UbiB family protein [Lentzea sp. BCCO 10_0856]MDX8037065.1 AarF/UbiB family protein [Lentzea sp. BCCO 10_0856]